MRREKCGSHRGHYLGDNDGSLLHAYSSVYVYKEKSGKTVYRIKGRPRQVRPQKPEDGESTTEHSYLTMLASGTPAARRRLYPYWRELKLQPLSDPPAAEGHRYRGEDNVIYLPAWVRCWGCRDVTRVRGYGPLYGGGD